MLAGISFQTLKLNRKILFWYTPDCTSESENLCRIACRSWSGGIFVGVCSRDFLAESLHDLIGHNGKIKRDKLLSTKEII